MTQVIRLAKAVQTCCAAPSQWNAWTEDGQYLYLKYRGGKGRVWAYDGPDERTWTLDTEPVAEFEHGGPYDGCLSLEAFCELAGLISPPADSCTPCTMCAQMEDA